MIIFNGNDGQDHQFALSVGDEAANQGHQPRLVFARYGDETFLNKVFFSGGDDYRQLLRTSKRKSSSKNELPVRSFLCWSSQLVNYRIFY